MCRFFALPRTSSSMATTSRKRALSWTRGNPYRQPYYTYSPADSRWHGVLPTQHQPDRVSRLQNFTVMNWNIDFMLPLGDQRLAAALNHLRTLVVQSPNPTIIFLQEMTKPDLKLIQKQDWIRSDYHITDISDQYWESTHYGTCTLVPRLLSIKSVFRVHYPRTNMERDGLFVDILTGQDGCLRLCNTHLESLAFEPPLRPSQMQCAATFMQAPEVLASVLGGDLNAIQPFDRTLHTENKLADAYLASGGQEDHEEGYTWGQMARTRERTKFGLSRMDKLLFVGAVQVDKFERFGYGVEIDGDSDRVTLCREGLEKPWVTDHLGVKGDFHLITSIEVQSEAGAVRNRGSPSL